MNVETPNGNKALERRGKSLVKMQYNKENVSLKSNEKKRKIMYNRKT